MKHKIITLSYHSNELSRRSDTQTDGRQMNGVGVKGYDYIYHKQIFYERVSLNEI